MKNFLLLLFSIVLIGACTSKSKTCIVNGIVVNRPNSKVIYIAPSNTDFRANKNFAKIEISPEGTFSHTIPFEHSIAYSITFEDELQEGSWFPIEFIVEDGIINFELYPIDSFHKNVVKGGELNSRYNFLLNEPGKLFNTDEFSSELRELEFPEEYFSKVGEEWFMRFNKAETQEQRNALHREELELVKNGKFYSSRVMELNAKIDSVNVLRGNWIFEQISSSIDEASLSRISSLLRFYMRSNKETDSLIEIFDNNYREKFASNPTTLDIIRDIAALKIVVGEPYINFTAPDLNGEMVNLSDEIDGKVAVIDLWASWCGPCITTSKSFIPIWEKYKDRGFTIVGVAREQENTKAMKEAINKYGFSWTNLVELDDRISLWAQYGAGNAGGKVILVGKDGKIVDVGFDAKTLEAHLERLL